MKFGFISKDKMDLAAKESDFVFIEAAYCENEEYFEVSKSTKKFKILDNSAYLKKQVSSERLAELAQALEVDAVIAPDTIQGDGFKSLEKSIRFIENYKVDCSFEVVVQGEDIQQLKAVFLKVIEIPKVAIVGIPKWLGAALRTRFAWWVFEMMILREKLKQIHLLGFNGEKEFLCPANYMDTARVFRSKDPKNEILKFRRKYELYRSRLREAWSRFI